MRKIVRAFWILFYRFIFSIKKVSYGQDMRVCNSIYFKLGKNIIVSIGNNFGFSSGAGYNPLSRNIKGSIELENGARLKIGDNVGISSSCLWVFEYIEIHDRVKIGADCILLDSDAHSLHFMDRRAAISDRPNAKKRGIIVEEDVLIGMRSIVLKGVRIGARSIIGSGSVVTKDIPSDEIWAGNPAIFIRKINL
tara:strand:+ start:897 stop:1478 length:582 start_codon:yes stop_codon:yes gene_type:complete